MRVPVSKIGRRLVRFNKFSSRACWRTCNTLCDVMLRVACAKMSAFRMQLIGVGRKDVNVCLEFQNCQFEIMSGSQFGRNWQLDDVAILIHHESSSHHTFNEIVTRMTLIRILTIRDCLFRMSAC